MTAQILKVRLYSAKIIKKLALTLQLLNLKVILVGDTGSGKTSFMERYINDRFAGAYKATIGVDFVSGSSQEKFPLLIVV